MDDDAFVQELHCREQYIETLLREGVTSMDDVQARVSAFRENGKPAV